MTKVLLDTNVYTALLNEGGGGKSLIVKAASLSFKFLGFEEIKHELKAAPRMATNFSKNLRVLRLYDSITTKEYRFEQRMMDLAVEYYTSYRSLGGGISHKDIITDFLIVACASLKQVDVVISEDSNSLLNAYSKRTYADSRHNLAVPKLWTYDGFKREVEKKVRLK